MTSSLVGSEMCIRDRRPGEAVEEATARFDLLHSIAMAQGVHEHSRTSVSYTHLTLPTICSV
eukprot:8452146-Prorocentrum_lima.AAC.1